MFREKHLNVDERSPKLAGSQLAGVGLVIDPQYYGNYIVILPIATIIRLF